ncbi:MAG TPA: hypothetical protein VEQ60_24615 [Longimicrobium sp.]|nr:hypothetical protein [Longimicrobium sp.]
MIRWEYLHVRASVGSRNYSPTSFDDRRFAVFHLNGHKIEISTNPYEVDIQDSVVQLLNRLGEEGWELVSHSDRVVDLGMLGGPTDYHFFLKRQLPAGHDAAPGTAGGWQTAHNESSNEDAA